MKRESSNSRSVNLSGYILAAVLSILALIGAWIFYSVLGSTVFSVFYIVVVIVASAVHG